MSLARRSIALVGTAAAVTGLAVTVPAEAATTASPLRITKFVADPSGADRKGDNRQMNRELVMVRNVSGTSIKLENWTVRDVRNKHLYRFGKGFTLAKGASVTLHTGSGRNTRTDLYWNQKFYVWNNTGDTATVRTPAGKTVVSCTYTKNSSGSKAC